MTVIDLINKTRSLNAYIKKEGTNESTYYDTEWIKIIDGSNTYTYEFKNIGKIPAEIKNAQVDSFSVEIKLDDGRFQTTYDNKYRAKTAVLIIEIE